MSKPISLVVVAALLLAGCGGSDDEAGAAPPDLQADSGTSPSTDAGHDTTTGDQPDATSDAGIESDGASDAAIESDSASDAATEPDAASDAATEPDAASDAATESDAASDAATESDAASDAETAPDAPPLCGNGTLDLGEACDDGVNAGGYGKCAPGCVLGPRCGDGVLQGTESCDDGLLDGSYGGCTTTCERASHCGDGLVTDDEQCDDGNKLDTDGCTNACKVPTCSDGKQNGDETGKDCGGARCAPCTPPSVEAWKTGTSPVPLDQAVTVVFSQKMDPATLVDPNIVVTASGGAKVGLRFVPYNDSVELQVAHWEPSTTYTITVGVGAKDAWGKAMTAAATTSFTTGTKYKDGKKPPTSHPLANRPTEPAGPVQAMSQGFKAYAATTTDDANYISVSAPSELVLLGAHWDTTDTVRVFDPSSYNQSKTPSANSWLWSSNVSSLPDGSRRRAKRARLDADPRDELVVLRMVSPEQATLTVLDPSPSGTGGEQTSFTTKDIATISTPDIASSFDLAVGQADDDPYEEIFVLAGLSMTKSVTNPIDGRLKLWVFDDAAHGYAVLKNGVELASTGKLIDAVSIDVGDLDRDGTDEIAIAANVKTLDAYSPNQTTLAKVLTLADTTGVPLALPPHDQYDDFDVEQLLKIAIVNIDADPTQREVVLGRIYGGVNLVSNVKIDAFRYQPGSTPPTKSVLDHAHDIFFNDASFAAQPERTFLPVDLDGDGQKELLLSDGTVRRLGQDPLTSKPVLKKVAQTPFIFPFANDPKAWIAAGDVERSGEAEGHRADELVELGDRGVTILAFDPPAKEGDLYGVRDLSKVAAPSGSGTFSRPYGSMVVLADVDHDGVYVKYAGRSTELSQNHLIAVLAAPPCADGIGQNTDNCQSSFSFEENNGWTNTVSGKFSLASTAGFHLMMGGDVSLVVGVSVTLFELEAELTVRATAGFEYAFERDVSTGFTAATGYDDDLVIFSTTPYDVYHYEVVSGFDDAYTKGDEILVNVPLTPRTYAVSRTYYEANRRADDIAIDESILPSEHGILSSYPSDSRYDDWTAGKSGMGEAKDVIASTHGASLETMTPEGFNNVTTANMGVSTSSSFTGSLEIETELSAKTCVVGFCAGGTVGGGAGYALTYSFGDSVAFSGSVGGLTPASFSANKYGFRMAAHRMKRTNTANQIDQDFLVLGYFVD